MTAASRRHIVVHVRHFLSAAGKEAFARVFAEHYQCVAGFPGFVALHHSVLENDLAVVDVTLAFENQALLSAWRASPDHARIAASYRPLWTREPEVTFESREAL